MKRFLAAFLCLGIAASFSPAGRDKEPQKFLLERSYSVKNTSADQAIRIKVNIPDVVSCHGAKILKSTYSSQPASRKTFSNGMEQMIFELNLQPGEEKIISLAWQMLLSEVNVLETPSEQSLSEEDRALYLQPGTLYECDHPEIVAKANEITTGKTTDLEKAKSIFEFVKSNIEFYRFGAESKGALYALQNKGDCTEYAALIVAMCRASKIPARLNGVMVMKTDTGSAGTDNHNHAEVFLSDYGWVPAEATFKSASFGQQFNFEIILRKGLRTDKGNAWFSYNIAKKHNSFKEIKMLGHKWKKINDQ
jgi:hypothetical protein